MDFITQWLNGSLSGEFCFTVLVSMLPVVERAVSYLREAGIAKSRLWAYVLVEDVEDAHRRVLTLERMGVLPFAQPYRDSDGGEPTSEQRAFARWVNIRPVHKSCTWEEYDDPGKEGQHGR